MEEKIPKAFISYCWTSEQYKRAVLDFATILVKQHINVTLDQWDLLPGHDMYSFMEYGIAEADKVLILCNKEYAERANNRQGGVGTETMIITPELFRSNPQQEKFIPIFMEGIEHVPSYLQSRIGIDLTADYDKGIDQIVHVIFGVPMTVKPKLGPPPDFFQEYNKHNRNNTSVKNIMSGTAGNVDDNADNAADETAESIESLKLEIEEIYDMIIESDNYLHEHKSNAVEAMHNEIQQFSQSTGAIKLANRLPDIIQKNSGDPRKLLIGGLIGGIAVGVGYLGALAYDGVKNTMTEMKVEKVKDACYRELESRYRSLVEKQDNIFKQLRNDNAELMEERENLKKDFSDIHVLCSRIKDYLKRQKIVS